MEIIVSGRLIEVVSNKSKDGKKDYFSANVYANGKMYRVGLTPSLFVQYKPLEGTDVIIEGVQLWSSGNFSLYCKDGE